MAKLYKIQIDDGKGTDIKPIRVEQGTGDKGAPVRLVGIKSARYELLEDNKHGPNFAPDQLRVQRMGKSLFIWFDGSTQPDVVIDDYYADETGVPTLMGVAENGNAYEYVPQDPAVSSMPAQLKDSDTLVAVALGGPSLPGGFALAGLPVVAAAAGGISGLAIAGGVAAAAALGGGGGGGAAGTAPTPDAGGGGSGGGGAAVPSGQTGGLTPDTANDTGKSQTDGITKNNKPELTINAEAGATVVATVNGKDYPATETSAGVYKVKLDALPDGVYTPVIKVTNSAGTSTVNGTPFTIDTSGATNQPNDADDPNKDIALSIGSVSEDTGTSTTDGKTADQQLVVSGAVGAFSDAAGDRLLVQFINAADDVVHTQEVVPSDGAWAMTTPTGVLPTGVYTIKAVIVDLAGNEVKSATKPVEVVAEGLSAAADTAAIMEDVAQVTGDLVQGTGPSKAGADSATHVGYSSLSISQVKAGTGAYAAVGAEKVITGTFGTLTLQKPGGYTYELNNTNADVQALTENQQVKDEFTYTLTDGAGRTSEAKLTVNITGKNDVATFWDSANVQITSNEITVVNPLADADIQSVLVVKDADAGQKGLFNVGDQMTFDEMWQVGTLTIDKIDDAGQYEVTYAKDKTFTNDATTIRHDLFTVKSLDGKSSQTFDFEVSNSATGETKQEFHTQSTDGIKVEGETTLSDALVLHGASTFDLTPTNVSLTSVERVDLRDAATQSVTLNLANLTSSDTVTIGGTQVHRLFVDGTSMDSVVFKHATDVQATTSLSNHAVAGYTLYRIDDTHDLLVSTTITNVTFSNS